MRILRQVFVYFFISIFAIPILAQNMKNENSLNQRDPVKILFIGSSYFNYNNLPSLFENLVVNSENEVYIDQSITNGLYLEDHANSSVTEDKINEENWDYVILQGVGRLMAYPEIYTDHPVYPALVTLQNKIHENCQTSKIIFCLPWAYEDGMTWLEGWTDTYVDMQIHIYDNTLEYSSDIGFKVSPVGWAWKTVLEESSFPLHYLHMSDWNHPSLKGSYLMACVIFSTIFQESTLGNTFYADLPEDEATYFQITASSTVLSDLDLWNITSIDDFVTQNKFHPLRNYPNPFNPSTTISFEANQFMEDSIVEIYNSKGQRVREFKITSCKLGTNSIVWRGSDESGNKVCSGVYFCMLRSKKINHIRKLILIK